MNKLVVSNDILIKIIRVGRLIPYIYEILYDKSLNFMSNKLK